MPRKRFVIRKWYNKRGRKSVTWLIKYLEQMCKYVQNGAWESWKTFMIIENWIPFKCANQLISDPDLYLLIVFFFHFPTFLLSNSQLLLFSRYVDNNIQNNKQRPTLKRSFSVVCRSCALLDTTIKIMMMMWKLRKINRHLMKKIKRGKITISSFSLPMIKK